ncbi:uncharacterized protein A4U43_C03F25260 [Asparagus officinalis]|uniref:Uncharacterized protein n=1 Tax=Asparagus officinalis TaxID=4686 RepID=A0A5P1FI10_ASPOF|nr:uncharacterized protein A4U43_C03F25260 [Asparagus officinalis]
MDIPFVRISCAKFNESTDMHLVYFYFAILMFGNLSSNEGSTFDQVGIISEVASIIREFTEPFSEDEESYSRPPANHGLNLMMTFLVDQYLVEVKRVSRHPVLLVVAADSSEGLQPPIRHCFSHEIVMSPLTEAQRADMLSSSLEGVSKIQRENIRDDLIKDVIGQTSGFMPMDINGLVADDSANFVHRILNDKDNNGSRESGEKTISKVMLAQAVPGSSSSIKVQCSSEVEKHLSLGTMI